MDEQKKKKEQSKRKDDYESSERDCARLRQREDYPFDESMEIIVSRGSIKGIKI